MAYLLLLLLSYRCIPCFALASLALDLVSHRVGMLPVIARYLLLFLAFNPITVSDILDDGIFGGAELEAESIMGDSNNLYASSDILSGLSPTDPADGFDQAEDYDFLPASSSAADYCSSDLGDMPIMRKARRGESCQATGDSSNEPPFILPKTLLDAGTMDSEKYCPREIFYEFQPYLVCSSGFSRDMVDVGSGYQALLNSEIGQ